jgi:hypothetical protein
MAAVLSCGPHAALSHTSAAALFEIQPMSGSRIEVSVPLACSRRPHGIVVHRRRAIPGLGEVTQREGVPVTSVACTLVDLAAVIERCELEAAVNEADKLDLVDPEELRDALDHLRRRPGVAALRRLLDSPTFTLTDSELERRFLPLAHKAGLAAPQSGIYVNGFKVDFYWPSLGLVVETDGLRYHRTPAQQARDRVRDQAHTAAGLTPLRFTRAQVRFDPRHVQATLAAAAKRLAANK